MMPVRVLLIAIAALLTAAVGPSGCGDEDESANASDEALIVKADFVQAANAVCEKRSEQMQAKARRIYRKGTRLPQDEAIELALEEVIGPGLHGEARDLRALEPPPGDEEQVEELVVAIEDLVARMERDLGKSLRYPYRKTENLAAAYGLPACGHP